MSKVSEVQGQLRRLRSRDDRPEELKTTAEALAEEYEPEVSTKTTEASAEEAEETTRPSERLQRRRRQCVYGLRGLTTPPSSFLSPRARINLLTTPPSSSIP